MHSQDPWHRYHNDHKAALTATGTWLVVLERTVVFNCTSAPWSNHGFFGQIQGASEEYFSLRDHTCPLYALLYEAPFACQCTPSSEC
jgi:predicted ArsR family transcriptional regulator